MRLHVCVVKTLNLCQTRPNMLLLTLMERLALTWAAPIALHLLVPTGLARCKDLKSFGGGFLGHAAVTTIVIVDGEGDGERHH